MCAYILLLAVMMLEAVRPSVAAVVHQHGIEFRETQAVGNKKTCGGRASALDATTCVAQASGKQGNEIGTSGYESVRAEGRTIEKFEKWGDFVGHSFPPRPAVTPLAGELARRSAGSEPTFTGDGRLTPLSSMTDMKTQSPRIATTFENLRKTNRIALMPFIPAGYPDLATTSALLPALQAGGANLIEVGFPFSDPIADGPTIQAAFTEALKKKLKVSDILSTVASTRAKVTVPLLAMVSYSIVFRYGPERFFANAKAAGFDGLILPDLPPPEAAKTCEKVWAAGLDTVLLVAPTTSPARRQEIADLSSGFVYYLSVSGITGERDALPPDLIANLTELRKMTSTPVCVGFGISKPSHIKQLSGFADGAIVGSAVVKKMTERLSDGANAIAESAGTYTKHLLTEVA